MIYCTRCGELNRSEKCTRCGTTQSSNTGARQPSIDRWQSRYLGNIMGLNALKLQPKSPEITLAKAPAKPSPRPVSLREVAAITSPKANLPILTIIPPAQINECNECHKKLSGKIVRLPESNTRYHWACLRCFSCHDPFEDVNFYVDANKSIYHPKCAPLAMNFRACTRCSLSITDNYLMIHHSVIHSSCFRCTTCSKVLQPSTFYTDIKGAHCQDCTESVLLLDKTVLDQHLKIVPQLMNTRTHLNTPMQASSFSLKSNYTTSTSTNTSTCASPINSANHSMIGSPQSGVHSLDSTQEIIPPSALMSSRGRPLPRFGTTKTCPGCTQKIASIHEEKQGPKATRWHIKCLTCTRCSKQLDSAATVLESKTGGNPWCSMCLLWKKNEVDHSTESFSLALPGKLVRID
ncbi:hypothetical protein BDF14DRAFT_881333 [Spinellus fusiger]|nr:hypothetical protein BDF14DRAFT_881333 [Spinellus fusiger]